ncbi:Phosphatidylinositol 3-kinase VPS34, involved in signal transduction [Pseudoloma neurophilia]|uniref:Phosphatidylinositol 3-kinase VPS34, involved in signal transduction n=1 Tax=Pseudoloma neurophilia TaxID=146866 RepID=A0A0R0M238_9MICR|nr:Phosphatidylinositol 3-kinase VPS34, involved in signal transduction [Pseudoloma neurophilia]
MNTDVYKQNLEIVEKQLNLLNEIKKKYIISDFNKKKSRMRRIYNILSMQYLEKTIQKPLLSFFGVNKVTKVKFENVYSSASYPLQIELVTKERSETVLYKRAPDLRNDFTLLPIFEYLNYIHGLKAPTYNILLIDESSAMIEILKGQPLSIEHISIFLDAQPEKQRIFLECMAMCVVQTYLFGIGDRNNDNFIVTNALEVFHIDFSFILGADPKLFRSMIENTIRIPTILQYILKSDVILEEEFKNIFITFFLRIRQYKKKIVLLLDILELHPIIKTKKLRKYFLKQLHLELKDEKLVKFLIELLENGINVKFNKWLDISNQVGKFFRK